VTALGAVIEDLVKANNAVDIYEEYFAGKVCIGRLLGSALTVFGIACLSPQLDKLQVSASLHTCIGGQS